MIVGVKGMLAVTGNNHVSTMLRKLDAIGVDGNEFSYLKFHLFDTYILHRVFGTTKRLYKTLTDGDSIVCHSFGGVLVTELLKEMAFRRSTKKLKNIYMFNPAVDSDTVFPTEHFEKMFIFHQPKDRLLSIAECLPFNIMGDLGKDGYKHPNSKIVNYELAPIKESFMNHSDAMYEPQLTTICQFIKDQEAIND